MGTGTPSATGSAGSSSMGSSVNALTLTVDSSVLAQAPAFNASSFSGTVGPEVAQFWSGQGLSIPATGASTSSSAILIQGQLTGLNVVDSSGQALGQVQDFVVNTQTGDLVYAVLTGGTASLSSTLGSKFYLVPLSALTWQTGSQSSSSSTASNMGQVQANVSSDAFQSAPSVSSIDQLDMTSSGWNSSIDSYWSTAK
jgi:sporulation protein YlmC with PRC-barrel domain